MRSRLRNAAWRASLAPASAHVLNEISLMRQVTGYSFPRLVSRHHLLTVMRFAFCSALVFLAIVHYVHSLPNCDACRKLIGVDEAASTNDIKKAYHQKALENHPDKNPDDPTAQERFLRIQGCYEGLIKRKCTGAHTGHTNFIMFFRLCTKVTFHTCRLHRKRGR